MVTSQPNGKGYYLPHEPVIRENAESTKMRIVYDASAKSNCSSPLLNKCLETGQHYRIYFGVCLQEADFFLEHCVET